jgi:hypothetical protein
MTVQSRGARSRRADRGPGWILLTALLVLAIVASSTLVFTDRVELLRLAVVLSLWAAVMAAFVTVIYRRQTDVAQARARDMKHVYDLQLDREIAARREYEASVEAHLRRQLSREVRAQAADEMAALRAELASLRSQLEVMLGTDLAHRPALGSERVAVPMPPPPDRVESSRVTVISETVVAGSVVMGTDAIDDAPIIDVAEEPLVPAQEAPVTTVTTAATVARETVSTVETETVVLAPVPEPDAQYGGTHRRPESQPPAERPVAPPPAQPEAPWRPPEVRLGRHSVDNGQPPPPPRPAPVAPPEPPRGRHWVPPEPPPGPPGRHRPPEQDAEPVIEEPQPSGQHADGQSFSELLQRLQVDRPRPGGGRRRRED